MDHPKDTEFLNTPIRFYYQMETIFGSGMATGRHALGSNEPQGVNTNHGDSGMGKIAGNFGNHVPDDKTELQGEGSKATYGMTSNGVGCKRKRAYFSEEEVLMMTNMTNAVNNVANALRETGPAHIDADLYHAMMDMPGFTKEALIVAFSQFLDNKAHRKGFVDMVDSHRVIWLRKFVAKHYYI